MKKTSENTSVHQPHDKLVKRLLSNPEAAKDILSLYLPKEVLDIADLSCLKMQKDSFIDDEYRTYAVDILYKTKFQNSEGYIWCLIEHQSSSDPWMPVRIFKYIGLIWDHIRKQSRPSRIVFIPLIYPLIIYQGDKPYEHSLTLSDLIQPEATKNIFETLFVKPFSMVDLSVIPDETLRKEAQNHLKGVALLLTLKHRLDKNLSDFFAQILSELLKQLNQRGDNDEVFDLLYYILKQGEFLDKNRFLEIVITQQFSSEVEKKMTTVAQQLLEEGIVEGKIEVAKRLLAEQTSLSEKDLITWVHRMTGLSNDKIQELRKKH